MHRYFEAKHHAELVPEFKEELATYGRIYMYRLRPDYEMGNVEEYPGECEQAKQ
jgi:urocanate hydratase